MTAINRRRFLTLSACALGSALAAPRARAGAGLLWQGRALGADLSIRLAGADPAASRGLIRAIEAEARGIEARFSLYRDSALTRLNRDGRLAHPDATIRDLFALADQVHRATQGCFDPTVQPLYLAHATGTDPAAARDHLGWQRVRIGADDIRLDPGMALTFNGIAQGFAADRIAALMRVWGLWDVLIDMGEVMALGTRPGGGPWRAAIAAPDGTQMAGPDLRDRALATSAPLGTRIGTDGVPHILHPAGGAPRWALVSVSGPRAAVCDALSTAFCLMPDHQITAALAQFPGTRVEHLA